ncbi:MAG: hypothetical protein IKL37_05775 [Alphaproteobacteria bacterium]|nr:hypothetical protein [Alphaproteobacteria bacterium]MBR6685736.1 hypothetical protein [Alphaproteobacteria bacterium]
MEKYYVTENDTEHDLSFCQNIKAQNKAKKTKDIILQYSMPKIPVGTKIKVYETANKDPLPITMAYSYKINGKRFVSIDYAPQTMYAIKEFWSQLSFLDGVRLHREIKQQLRRRGISPAFSKITNLRLFLGDKIIDCGR